MHSLKLNTDSNYQDNLILSCYKILNILFVRWHHIDTFRFDKCRTNYLFLQITGRNIYYIFKSDDYSFYIAPYIYSIMFVDEKTNSRFIGIIFL